MVRLASLSLAVSLLACSSDGKPPPPRLLAKGPAPAFGLAADATHVYWTAGAERAGTVYRVTKAAEQQRAIRSSLAGVGAVALDARNVYWVENDGTYWLIRGQPKDGDTPTTLVTNGVLQGSSLRAEGGFVYWSVDHGGPENLGAIRRVSISAGYVQELARAQKYAKTLQLADDFVYWLAAPADGLRTTVIRRTAKGGGAIEDVTVAAVGINALAVARGRAVWSVEEAPHDLWTCEVAACVPRVAQSGARYHGLGISDGAGWFWSRSDGFVRLSADTLDVALLGPIDAHWLTTDDDRLFVVSSTSGEVWSHPTSPR